MKKILAIFVAVLCLTAVGCKKNNDYNQPTDNPSTPAIKDDPIVIEPEVIIPEVTRDWIKFPINFGGVEKTLPMSYADFLKAFSLELQESEMLQAHKTKQVYLYDTKGRATAFVGFINNTDNDADLTKCDIFSVSQTLPVLESGVSPITFPGSLQAGMECDPENLDFDGEKTITTVDEGKGVESSTITFWSENKSSFFEIRTVGNKISSINLVYRA